MRWYTDDDGSFVFRGRLTAEDGARLVQAIQAAESCVSAGTSAGQRAADGLVVLADAYLGDPSGRDLTITVEVDAAATPPAALERLLCDASVQMVTRDAAGVVLNYGRKRRTASKTQKRVLFDRDQGCRFTGCDSPHAPTPTRTTPHLPTNTPQHPPQCPTPRPQQTRTNRAAKPTTNQQALDFSRLVS